MADKGHPNSLANLTPGNQLGGKSLIAQKTAEAEAWNNLVDVGKELTELLKYGKDLLKDKRVSPAQKVTVWKAMFEKLADKVMPPAAKDDSSSIPNINITNLPTKMIKDKKG